MGCVCLLPPPCFPASGGSQSPSLCWSRACWVTAVWSSPGFTPGLLSLPYCLYPTVFPSSSPITHPLPLFPLGSFISQIHGCVCVSKSLLFKSGFFFLVPIWACHLLWVSYLSTHWESFLMNPTNSLLPANQCQLGLLPQHVSLFVMTHFHFFFTLKMTNKDCIQLELCLFVALAEAFQDAIIIAIVITG